MSNKKLPAVVEELFIRSIKLNISTVFITQSYFSVPKDIRLDSTHYWIMKIKNKREIQNIAINHFADIDYKDFVKIYRERIKETFSFLTIDATLLACDPLRFTKNLLNAISLTLL